MDDKSSFMASINKIKNEGNEKVNLRLMKDRKKVKK